VHGPVDLHPERADLVEGVRQPLAQIAVLVLGRNAIVEHRHAGGRPEQLSALAAEPGPDAVDSSRTHALRRTRDLSVRPVVNDDVADVQLEREDELLGLRVSGRPLASHGGILAQARAHRLAAG
jgi:hypothetical protein